MILLMYDAFLFSIDEKQSQGKCKLIVIYACHVLENSI